MAMMPIMPTALEEARTYIGAAYGPTYSAWMLLDDSTAGKTLVSATRYLDQIPWKGTATGILDGNPTDLSWPRSGVIVDGVEIDSTTIPEDITKATFEMAVIIAAKPGVVSQVDGGSNIQSVGGGGAPSVSYFYPTSSARGTAPKYPYVVQQLIGKYLSSAGAGDLDQGGSGSFGRTCSGYSQAAQYNLRLPE